LLLSIFQLPTLCYGQDELVQEATWSVLSNEQVRSKIGNLLEAKGSDELVKEKVAMILSDENLEMTSDRLEQMALAISIINPQLAPLVEGLSRNVVDNSISPSPLEILESDNLSPTSRNNIKLLLGRSLVQDRLYDEALQAFQGLETDNVLDPAALLFYQALAHHRLLEKDKCLKLVDRLFENESRLPRRFVQVGRLMKRDIAAMKAESLDQVARMMDDINRRISLYRSGARVIKQEEKVLDILDKIVEELEKKQQQQQGASTNPSSPMQDSRAVGGKGDGQAQTKDFGEGGEWGDLPPQKRAEAMAEMAKDLPPHYRQVIEAYFRKLAEEDK